MAKIRIEVCLISARGLRRSSSLWKVQWFAVGWIYPDHKYCSKIDASGSANPSWKTKFAVSLEDSNPNLHSLSLNVEVYGREPLFLREKLHGSAKIELKEFLSKFANGGGRGEIQEVGSFQLRKKKSDKPRGFVDVSLRLSQEREGSSSYPGDDEGGIRLPDHKNGHALPIEGGENPSYPSQPYPPSFKHHSTTNFSYPHPTPTPASHPNPSLPRPPQTPPPPPPPSHVGFLPTFLPGTGSLPDHYINLPSSNAGGHVGGRAGFGAGVGAGALAAGAVIFGDDFLSGFDYPMGLQSGSLTVSMDPPF